MPCSWVPKAPAPLPVQVLFELLTWRLPWNFTEMSPYKVAAAAHCSLPTEAQRLPSVRQVALVSFKPADPQASLP